MNKVSSLMAVIICSLSFFTCHRTTNEQVDGSKNSSAGSSAVPNTASLIIEAATFYSNNQFEEATIAYSKLIKIDSSNGEYYYRKGYCCAQLKRDSLAVIYFIQAAKHHHREFDVYKNVGLLYMRRLKNEKAIEYFNKCLEIAPHDTDIKAFIKGIRNNSKEMGI